MTKGFLFFFTFMQAFIGAALAGAEADVPSRVPFQPAYPSAPSAPIVVIDPSNFQPISAGEQVKALKARIEELGKKLQSALDYRDEKTRITELRDLLRETSQLKLSLTAIDTNLSQSRDIELREAATARQLLAAQQPAFGIGPNSPTDQIQRWGRDENNNLNFTFEQIEQERKLLRALGGPRGDRLVALAESGDDSFSIRGFSERTDAIRSQITSILKDDEIREKSPETAPPASPNDEAARSDSIPSSPPQGSSEKSGNDLSKTSQQGARSDHIIEQAVDATLRLLRLQQDRLSAQRRVDYAAALYSNKKRLDDYRDVDIKIVDMRSEVAQLQSKIAALQDSINQGIDTAVNQIGGHEWFTQIATVIFGAAVVIVIGSFFALAFRDKDNRLLAHPDVGLQFVTLFSIIIAIILFGILNILGSKELSALLGGISGYILGRGTLGFSDRRRPDDNRIEEKELAEAGSRN